MVPLALRACCHTHIQQIGACLPSRPEQGYYVRAIVLFNSSTKKKCQKSNVVVIFPRAGFLLEHTQILWLKWQIYCFFCVCVSSAFQFSVFLGLIFFLELTAGILAFVFKDWIKDQLNFFINNNVKAYRDDIDLQNLIDFAQEYVSAQLLSDVSVTYSENTSLPELNISSVRGRCPLQKCCL